MVVPEGPGIGESLDRPTSLAASVRPMPVPNGLGHRESSLSKSSSGKYHYCQKKNPLHCQYHHRHAACQTRVIRASQHNKLCMLCIRQDITAGLDTKRTSKLRQVKHLFSGEEMFNLLNHRLHMGEGTGAGVVVEQTELLASHNQMLSMGEVSHTGQVGTALYVAPELNTCCLKATYNQKVDIYSLGVMFFEMCYRPLHTHMERMKVLADLRSEDCLLPADFKDNGKLSKTNLLRWMLLHDPLQRPSSAELLQSDLLPPPQFEERELQELLRHTLNNPQSKLYKYLVASCFSQYYKRKTLYGTREFLPSIDSKIMYIFFCLRAVMRAKEKCREVYTCTCTERYSFTLACISSQNNCDSLSSSCDTKNYHHKFDTTIAMPPLTHSSPPSPSPAPIPLPWCTPCGAAAAVAE
ncbi:Eukaryotic translation initiation factor 2 alpha kinase 4 [Homalodisca vitripennis]|nr:Eukaryotic translation initiation factor 2 alpha kinase 4 [Homalodisca vitripennis]